MKNPPFGQTLNISTGKNYFSPGTYFQSQLHTMKNHSGGDMLNNDYEDRRRSVEIQSVQNRLSAQQCNLVSLLSPDQGASQANHDAEAIKSWHTIKAPSRGSQKRVPGRSQSVDKNDDI